MMKDANDIGGSWILSHEVPQVQTIEKVVEVPQLQIQEVVVPVIPSSSGWLLCISSLSCSDSFVPSSPHPQPLL